MYISQNIFDAFNGAVDFDVGMTVQLTVVGNYSSVVNGFCYSHFALNRSEYNSLTSILRLSPSVLGKGIRSVSDKNGFGKDLLHSTFYPWC